MESIRESKGTGKMLAEADTPDDGFSIILEKELAFGMKHDCDI